MPEGRVQDAINVSQIPSPRDPRTLTFLDGIHQEPSSLIAVVASEVVREHCDEGEFGDEFVGSTSPESYVRYPGIRNQILVSRIEGPASEPVVLNESRAQFRTSDSFAAFSIAAELTNYDTSFWPESSYPDRAFELQVCLYQTR